MITHNLEAYMIRMTLAAAIGIMALPCAVLAQAPTRMEPAQPAMPTILLSYSYALVGSGPTSSNVPAVKIGEFGTLSECKAAVSNAYTHDLLSGPGNQIRIVLVC